MHTREISTIFCFVHSRNDSVKIPYAANYVIFYSCFFFPRWLTQQTLLIALAL